MDPWHVNWSPQFQFPWSGNVQQDISPRTNWFSEQIKKGGGDPEVEEEAFKLASYGTQLAMVVPILIELAKKGTIAEDSKVAQKLERLIEIDKRIGEIAQRKREAEQKKAAPASEEEITAALLTLKKSNPEAVQRIKDSL